ncbi:triose-phosphate isomerase family protein [Microlunatus speluncae]|uniref:triose-phosphate isomerase family protein n=1 Tax=Microlunatus speluncae TaxID=2594267 RepID=UPI00126650B4|nr:triose-phosphate isomerase family protein [Microlunatus speluncae]
MITPPKITIGISLKLYFGQARTLDWSHAVAAIARDRAELLRAGVELFVLPTFPALVPVLQVIGDAPVTVGAQDLHWADSGAYTGEVSGAELAEIGVRTVEVGHAERRRLFGETDEVINRKTGAALRNGLVPVLCVGETDRLPTGAAITIVQDQIATALAGAAAGRVIIAYEPVWAIGAPEPAPDDHIREVCSALRGSLARPGSVIYGGAAGPGLLGRLGDAVDGLFLGRYAHDPEAVRAVLDEAAARLRGGVSSS